MYLKGFNAPTIVITKTSNSIYSLMESSGKHSFWSALLFLYMLHCANGVASFGVSVLPGPVVSGGDGIALMFTIGALTIFFSVIRKFLKAEKAKCSSIKQCKPNSHPVIGC